MHPAQYQALKEASVFNRVLSEKEAAKKTGLSTSYLRKLRYTGGGPAGSTHIWITHIYEIAFQRLNWGAGAAYAVILFLVMMLIGYFYVRALTRGDESRAGA